MHCCPEGLQIELSNIHSEILDLNCICYFGIALNKPEKVDLLLR